MRTQQSTDQAYLVIQPETGPRVQTDPRRMLDGRSVRLDQSVPFNLNDQVEVQLWEQDAPNGRNDRLGSLSFDRAYENLGEFPFHIYHRQAHYVLTIEVTEGTRRPQAYTVDLVRLECRDAQERTDRPYLKINGEQVWGPVETCGKRRRAGTDRTTSAA